MVGVILATVVALAALLPVAVVAQGDEITPQDIQWEWQLLTQLDADRNMEDVPAGVGATLLLRSGAASGEAACSTYDSSYSNSADVLNIFVAPEEVQWRDCDPESRAFDELFYRNLGEIASIRNADDVLVVRDVIGQNLMVFTRATIDNDPTAARWSLARIGGADGSVEPVIQGLTAWMEFLRGGSLVGSTGCGAFLGKYDTNEGRIDITDVDYRLGACTEGARAQAERILATLAEITDFQVRPAGLALEDEQGIIRLALTPDLDLAKRTWTPTAVYDPAGQQQFGSGTELTTSAVQFIGGKLEGRSICRPFTGNALRSGLAVSIGGIQFFDEYCKGKVGAGTLGDIEAAFVDALEGAASYALRGDELAITDVNGITRAVLEPQPPLTGTTWEVFRMRRRQEAGGAVGRRAHHGHLRRGGRHAHRRRPGQDGGLQQDRRERVLRLRSRRRRPPSSTSSSSRLPARAAVTRTARRPAKRRRPSSSCSSQQTVTWRVPTTSSSTRVARTSSCSARNASTVLRSSRQSGLRCPRANALRPRRRA